MRMTIIPANFHSQHLKNILSIKEALHIDCSTLHDLDMKGNDFVNCEAEGETKQMW